MEIFSSKDVGNITMDSEDYPKLLLNITRPPVCIHYLGNPKIVNKLIPISIIGSRNMSMYGYQVIEKILYELQGCAIVTVSGFTRGVDITVHSLSLKYNIPTIAVLPYGLGHLMKLNDGELIQKIVQNNGLILSEYAFEIEPKKWTFIERNRIVAGISLCTVVIEAAEGSGSLLTASLAHKFDRVVYAIPGNIFSPLSKGIFKLLNDYALLLVSGTDLISKLGFSMKPLYSPSCENKDISDIGARIIKHLKCQPLDIDSIGTLLDLSSSTISIEIFNLSILGRVIYSEGKYYAKNN